MAGDTRTTVYRKPKVYRALKVKAATTDRSVSELINAAVVEALREDAIDLEAFEKRAKEPSRPFEKALEDLKRDRFIEPRHHKVRGERVALSPDEGSAAYHRSYSGVGPKPTSLRKREALRPRTL